MTRKTIQPICMLSDADKVFLAAARRDDAKFAYVLALVCHRENEQGLSLLPTQEAYTFRTKYDADAFYSTARQLIAVTRRGLPNLFEILEKQIKCFDENVR